MTITKKVTRFPEDLCDHPDCDGATEGVFYATNEPIDVVRCDKHKPDPSRLLTGFLVTLGDHGSEQWAATPHGLPSIGLAHIAPEHIDELSEIASDEASLYIERCSLPVLDLSEVLPQLVAVLHGAMDLSGQGSDQKRINRALSALDDSTIKLLFTMFPKE